MPGPNDSLFREVFRQPEEMAGLLRSALPAEVAQSIDWQSLVRVEGSWIDEAMREYISDVLLQARMGNQTGLLYVLTEHRSHDDPDVLLDVMGYCVRIWKEWRREHRGGPLPPILPFVVRHGDRPWSGPIRLQQCIDLEGLDDRTAGFLRSVMPDTGLLMDDLATQSEQDLEARSLSVLAWITVLLLQHARGRSQEEVFAALWRWERILASVLTLHGQDRMLVLWSFLYRTTEVEPVRLVEVITKVLPSMSKEKLMTTAERLMREGALQARVEVLLSLLERRFGPLRPEVDARVRAGSTAELEQWTYAVLTARTVEEVFGSCG